MQPQLQKASKQALGGKGDCNLKDYVVFPKDRLQLRGPATKDNTGDCVFDADKCLPTLTFPSDHAIISATLCSRENGIN